MSSMEQPEELVVRVQPPEDALKSARPLPAKERFALDGVTDSEWAAFAEALADT